MIEINNLTKNFGAKQALQGVNLHLSAGKIIGLFGENGCGKTTLLRILAGLNTVTTGSVKINNLEIGPETKALISYMPDAPNFLSNKKVAYFIDYYADFFADFKREKCIAMLTQFGIDPESKFSQLSKGQREKVQVALVMACEAKIYLLDEPISGVDPLARETVLKTIIGALRADATLVIATHLITEIEPLLDEVILMRYGQIITHTTPEQISAVHEGSLNSYFKKVYAQ